MLGSFCQRRICRFSKTYMGQHSLLGSKYSTWFYLGERLLNQVPIHCLGVVSETSLLASLQVFALIDFHCYKLFLSIPSKTSQVTGKYFPGFTGRAGGSALKAHCFCQQSIFQKLNSNNLQEVFLRAVCSSHDAPDSRTPVRGSNIQVKQQPQFWVVFFF